MIVLAANMTIILHMVTFIFIVRVGSNGGKRIQH